MTSRELWVLAVVSGVVSLCSGFACAWILGLPSVEGAHNYQPFATLFLLVAVAGGAGAYIFGYAGWMVAERDRADHAEQEARRG